MNPDATTTIQNRLATADKDVFIAAAPENMYYLTGEYPVTGVYVITREEAFFLVSRFSQYQVDARAVYTRHTDTGPSRETVLQEYVTGDVVCDDADAVSEVFPEAETVEWVEALRAVKTREEVKQLQEAAAVTVAGMRKAADMLRNELSEGITAFDVAAEVESLFKKHNCTNAFHTAGPADNLVQVNAVTPHKPLSEKRITPEDVVIVDVGARHGLYCMDMSRTFCQDPSSTVQSMFDAVETAQQHGVNQLGAGVQCSAVAGSVRDVLQTEDWDPEQYFIHGLGHGVGIDVHERPRLTVESDDVLESGHVVTVEPGLYVPGVGGIRIEDTVLITEDEVDVLTPMEKTLQ